MECLSGEIKWPQFVAEHFKDIREPFTAGMELLPDCNFKCIHCYAESEREKKEIVMTTEQIYSILDILVAHNCLEIYFTGGECLLHKDFIDIYQYAKKKGMLVSVLTNGSLICEKHIALWEEYPPELVSISLYGASDETYSVITGIREGFSQVMRSISLMIEAGIHYELKIIGMRQNYHDILLMRKFIREQGLVNSILAWDIRPMNDGRQDPIFCRVDPCQAMEIEIQDPERKDFLDHLALDKDRGKLTERQNGRYLYPCSAGKQFVFITYSGYMQSCVKTVDPRYDLLHGNFDEGWAFLGEEYVDKKASPDFVCLKCDKFKYCSQCTAAFKNETGDPEKPVSFYCELGDLRKKYMDNYAHEHSKLNK